MRQHDTDIIRGVNKFLNLYYWEKNMEIDQQLTEEQAAPLCDWTPNWLGHKRRKGEDSPPFIRVSERKIRYRLSDVLAWVESHRIEPKKAVEA